MWVGGEQIGYVDRDDAVGLAPIIDNLESVGCRATCQCDIYTRGAAGIFGANLRVLADKRLTGWVSRQVAAQRSPAPFTPSP